MHTNIFEQLKKKLKSYAKQGGYAKKIKIHAVSKTQHARFLRSKIDHISANSKQNSKRLYPVNQGPRGYCLMKKNRGSKSRDTVPLIRHQVLFTTNILIYAKM
jgi:hypothetical protein